MSGHMRSGSGAAHAGSQGGQSASLVARVNEKKAELESLKELRDLSAEMATQMEALEQKLATLSDGTEAMATVMSNWHNVLRAINMASAKLPQPKMNDEEDEGEPKDEQEPLPLPQTLVRIPTEHAPSLQAHADEALENEHNTSAT
ncbi:DASH complex subunit Dad2-domain-containing protein [Microdochium trichocladiopsis]|uniref:DASH complex subunit DAD2 n=1 Tax=Microdochium trichocladiopsis TaxID=1682393 RepID=A0A9P8YKN8_9PEZI|nr:DASH complex subunit Dad2-domain-containing protein [Microdochium trichocladiopsis]KAH7040765.1 DASH complex subunit Dad2-domain-containing protein [Microdochium trichocladiopsis]